MSELFGDEAVYQRTARGQRELVVPSGQLSQPERLLLGVVTGHTPLRSLINLGLEPAKVTSAVVTLTSAGMMEKVARPD